MNKNEKDIKLSQRQAGGPRPQALGCVFGTFGTINFRYVKNCHKRFRNFKLITIVAIC